MFVYCSLGCVFLVLAEEFIPNSVSWQLLCQCVVVAANPESLQNMGVPKQCMLEPCPQWCWERAAALRGCRLWGCCRSAVPRARCSPQAGKQRSGQCVLCWARTLCWARSPQSLLQFTAAGYVPSRTSSRRRAVLVCVISLLYGSSIQFPVAVSSG